jgi:hypothetical protein
MAIAMSKRPIENKPTSERRLGTAIRQRVVINMGKNKLTVL